MSTLLQEKLAETIIENAKIKNHRARKNKTQLLESVGYAVTTARSEQERTIKQKGVQNALIARGFSEDNAKRVVSEILDDKSQKARDRLTASELIFKVQGSFAPERHQHIVKKLIDFNDE